MSKDLLGQIPRHLWRIQKYFTLFDTPSACGGAAHLTTAYDEYAIKAFKINSIDYLLKPINIEGLARSIARNRTIQAPNQPSDFAQLSKNFGVKKYRSRFLVHPGHSLIPLSTAEMAYFLSEDSVTFNVHVGGKRYIINDTLDPLEKSLDPKGFIQANRQFLMLAKAIQRVHQHGIHKLKLTANPVTHIDIIVSELRVTAFKVWFNSKTLNWA